MGYRHHTSNSGSTNTPTAALPTRVAGDRLVAFIGSSAIGATVVTVPLGWVLQKTANGGDHTSWYFKTTAGYDPASDPGNLWAISGGNWVIDIFSYENGDEDVSIPGADPGLALSLSVTPTVAGTTLIGWATIDQGGAHRSWSWSGDMALGERLDQLDLTFHRSAADETLVGGSGVQQTRTGTVASSGDCSGFLVALKPQGGGGEVHSGTASGTFSFAGSSSGTKAATGTASGSAAWAGTAGGFKAAAGTGSGTVTQTGSASGSKLASGTAAGTHSWAGAASSHKVATGTASGTHTWAGSASGAGVGGDPSGTASGTHTWAGTASGHKVAAGTASGTHSWAGTTLGSKQAQGSAAGSFAFAGTASGHKVATGSAAGTFAFTGTAAGQPVGAFVPVARPGAALRNHTHDATLRENLAGAHFVEE